MKRFTGLLFAFFTILTFCFAQAPQKMTYQAVVRDANDNLVINSQVGIQISVLQFSTTGTPVYIENHSPVTNENGLFSLEIGGGSQVIGDFNDIAWRNGPFFLETQIDLEGGTGYDITLTTELLSVPYALLAENAEPWIRDGNSVYLANENLGVGTSSPLGGLHINSTDALTLQTMANDVGYPIYVRDMFGNQRLRWRLLPGPAATTLDFDLYEPVPDASLSLRFFRFANTSGNKELVFLRGNNTTQRSARIGVDGIDSYFQIHGGNFGIGTGTPESKLHVTDGDIYIENVNRGVIMRSPNGNCWRMTVNNSGQPQLTQIVCP